MLFAVLHPEAAARARRGGPGRARGWQRWGAPGVVSLRCGRQKSCARSHALQGSGGLSAIGGCATVCPARPGSGSDHLTPRRAPQRNPRNSAAPPWDLRAPPHGRVGNAIPPLPPRAHQQSNAMPHRKIPGANFPFSLQRNSIGPDRGAPGGCGRRGVAWRVAVVAAAALGALRACCTPRLRDTDVK